MTDYEIYNIVNLLNELIIIFLNISKIYLKDKIDCSMGFHSPFKKAKNVTSSQVFYCHINIFAKIRILLNTAKIYCRAQ